jgi:hypothetical protein
LAPVVQPELALTVARTLYARSVKHLRALLEHLRFGRRPPTGPLTTAEQATADELQTRTVFEESERTEHEHEHDAQTE